MTGYLVHYKTGTSIMTKPASQGSTSTYLLSLTRGATYTISVEAISQHLSGESDEMNITLQLGEIQQYNYIYIYYNRVTPAFTHTQ